MKMLLRNTLVVLVSALTLSACQAADFSNRKSQTINMPTVLINLDSDSDGVLDELDECPGTPYNVVIDKRGCPHSLLFGENEFMMEARAYYSQAHLKVL